MRGGNYKSCMVITYDDFDSPGLTVMLTYHDDVSKILPSGKFKLENTVKTYRIVESLPQKVLFTINSPENDKTSTFSVSSLVRQ